MKKNLLFLMLFASVISFEAIGQTCGRVSLIGEFNAWNGDHWMDRNSENPALFTTIISLDTSSNLDGLKNIIKMKFRENGAWTINWGDSIFPSGTGTQNGKDIPVPIDTASNATTDYFVTFNCQTGAYTFESVCGNIGLIGEFSDWASDHWLTRDAINLSLYTTIISLDTSSNQYGALDTIEMKFRESGNWAVNWGADSFPTGTGTQEGKNIKVPLDTAKAGGKTTDFLVTFNCTTGEYSFQNTNGQISLIGEFTNNWNGDFLLNRKATDPNMWEVALSLDSTSNAYGAIDTIEMKFRENLDWAINWGSNSFPSGIGEQDGKNIKVPIDTTGGGGKKTEFWVTFNSSTGEYSFKPSYASIAMIGAFNGWNGDIPMNRDAANPNFWKLSRSWYENSDVKFRANASWTTNWGNNTFPNGTGIPGGLNIPLTAGKYDVTFNSSTFEYTFTANPNFCGEIGMVGDFNTWGTSENPSDTVPTDAWLKRDPMYPSQFMIEYNFTASTKLLFRLDADPLFEDTWGGKFPEGNGVAFNNDTNNYIQVPGGKYQIYFNCKSHDFKFVRLGSAVIAPKVFAIAVDGNLNEADWKINQVISQVIEGTPGADLNEAYFGVTYNADSLYVGINITDGFPRPNDGGEVFIDGNKSGGAFDAFDIHLKFGLAGVEVIHGPEGIVVHLGFGLTATGYAAEVAIPWADLGVTPTEGSTIGFDIILQDDDTGTGVEYKLAWNGSLLDYENTSSFGDLVLGTLSCGCITLFNDNVGDVLLQIPSDSPTKYVGSFEMAENQNLKFRKDKGNAVTWGGAAFPNGTATLGGAAIPATTGRYRIAFDCLTREYTFTSEPATADRVAYSEFADAPPVIDGDLAEYTLSYGSDIEVEGDGAYNNTVTWGSRWDWTSLYLGVKVVDAAIKAATDPWHSDAIEYYIDGNHDRDGAFDGDFDTQLVQNITDPFVDTVLWLKADGVQFTNWESKLFMTSDGYTVELRLGWDAFGFIPGKGRSIGFSLGNDDNDAGGGSRDAQSVWYGGASNWNNTALLGDLQLAGGAYSYGIGDIVDYSDQIVLFPNPSKGNVYLRMVSDSFKGNVTMHVADITGRTVMHEQYNLGSDNLIQLDANLFSPGIYFVNLLGQDGSRAVKKLIIQ